MAGLLSKIAGGLNQFSGEVLNPTNNLGKLGAYLGAASGGSLGSAALAAMKDAQGQEEDQLRRQVQMAQLERAQRPEYQSVNLGNGGFGYFDPESGGLTLLREPEQVFKKPAVQEQVEYLRSLNPSMTDAQAASVVERALAGYAYSPEARQGKVADAVAIADRRASNSASLKAQPTYSQSHPGGSSVGGGGKISATRSVGGKVYRKIAGKWYED